MAQFCELCEGPTSTAPERWYRDALKAWPDDLPTRQLVAVWALEKGRIDFAKEQVKAVLRILAADGEVRRYRYPTLGRMLRGLIALWEKNWQKAEDNFQKAVLEDPNDLIARNNLALALVEQDDPGKKQRALDYAMANYRDRNNNFNALWTLGWVYFRRNEFDQAAFALELAARTTNGDATNADTATYQAHSLYQQGKKWQAKEVLAPLLQYQLFCMRPEALKLYEKVKDAKKPEDGDAARLHEAKATATRLLEAFRKGDNEAAIRLLTKVARRKVEETGRCVAPPANKDAKFEVDDAVYPTPDHDTAHVPSRWIAPDDAGKRRTDRVTWICRWEPEGWRVAAFDAYVFEGERPLHLTFEDPGDFTKKQKWLVDEIKRRGRQKPSPADEKKPK
jgi:tetratricopeptide (TPR) repeat protein